MNNNDVIAYEEETTRDAFIVSVLCCFISDKSLDIDLPNSVSGVHRCFGFK